MNISKNKLIYIIFILLFIFILVFSNNFVIYFTGKKSPKEIDINTLTFNSNVSLAVDFYNVYNNMTEDVAINGWAFCETEDSNENKTISVLLRGDKKTYSVKTDLISRNLQDSFPDYKIYGTNHGYGTEFSTLILPNGIYEVLLYDYENESNSGIGRTGRKLIKNKDGIKEYMPQIRDDIDIELDLSNISSSIKNSVSILEFNEDEFLLRGWAFIENETCDLQNVFLGIQESGSDEIDFYDTVSFGRKDTADYFSNDLYYNCGFDTYVRKDKLVAGKKYNIYIIIEKQGNLYYGMPINYSA